MVSSAPLSRGTVLASTVSPATPAAAGAGAGAVGAAAAAVAATVPVLGLMVPLSWALGATGGLCIGAASSALLALNGIVMGASGIVNGVLMCVPDWDWRAAFLSSMMAVAALARVLGIPPLATQGPAAAATCSVFVPATWQSCQLSVAAIPSVLVPAAAGILIGFGSQLGSGCTSGHGVCGLPRLSLRSAVAVGTFMATGAVTATLSNCFPRLAQLIGQGAPSWGPTELLLSVAMLAFLGLSRRAAQPPASTPSTQTQAEDGQKGTTDASKGIQRLLSSVFCGALFGVGLLISGMLDRFKVRAFLDPVHGWDPSLAFVMGGAVLLNLVAFPAILKREKPKYCPQFQLPRSQVVTSELVVGSALFGVGWGLFGLCPAPGVMNLVTGRADVFIWTAGLGLGMMLEHLCKRQ